MEYDLLVIGAGPAGYVAAARAAQIGLKTALVEKGPVGGMCYHWGCIPSKSFLESAKLYQKIRNATSFGLEGEGHISFSWKKVKERTIRIVEQITEDISALLAKSGVDVIRGRAEVLSPTSISVERRLLSATYIFLATGSQNKKQELRIPPARRLEIADFFALDEAPNSLVVLGNESTAVELCQLMAMIGKKVALVTAEERLMPGMDPYLARFAEKKLRTMGVEVYLETHVTGYDEETLHLGDTKIACEKLLNCSPRQAVVPPSQIKLDMEKGFLKVNNHLQTNFSSIFAIGDVNGIKPFVHVASSQALHAVNYITGVHETLDYRQHPINIYSEPEIAQVGFTEPELQAKQIPYQVTEFPLSSNGKAVLEGDSEGVLRLLSQKKYGDVLGAQIIAPHATDMISEAVAIMQMEGTIYDLARVVHAHPTHSEVFLEATWAAIDTEPRSKNPSLV